MSRIDGPDHRVIARRGEEFNSRMMSSVRDTLRAVTRGWSGVVTLDDLGGIMHEWKRRVDADTGLLNDVGQSYVDAASMTRAAQRDALVKLLRANDSLVAAADDAPFEIPLVTNDNALDKMANARNRLVNVGNDVWEDARAELLDGLQEGEGIAALQSRVMGVTDFIEARAAVIARSEIANVMNQGSLDQMRQIDAPGMTKEWIATLDNRTRPEHADVNGEKVGVNDTFSIGEDPGDAPNCRCTLGFDLPDEQLVDSACDCADGEIPLMASGALVAAIDLGSDLSAVCACETVVGEAFASQSDYQATLDQALTKIADAPVPSEAAIKKAQIELANARAGTGRAGGEARGGSAADRRKQRQNLFKEFGGEDKGYVICHGCGMKIHWDNPGSPANPHGYARFERGKIFVKCQGGGYQLKNLLPECFGCNRSRNDAMIRNENRC